MADLIPFNNSDFYNPGRGYREWLRSEIVSFPGETNKFIPNKNDAVRDWDQGMFRVIEVDLSTGMSVLARWVAPKEPDEDGPDNVFIATGPGYTSESFRMFLDQTVTPHTLAPDLRLHLYGSDVIGYKVFLGSDASEEYGTVISEMYDASNVYLGPMIPVTRALLPGVLPDTQYESGITAPMVGFTSRAIADGERVTIVAYTATGPQSLAQLVIVNSQAIRQSDSSKSYVKGITIDSPWLSQSDPKVIEFPLNIAVEQLPMTGIVHYRNRRERMAVNSGRMELQGLRNYIATEPGQEFGLTLTYTLAEDEISYGISPTTDREVTMTYIARTTPAEGAYNCRMYVYPNWISPEVGYRLEFWLYNQDRRRYWNVTPYVQLGHNSAPFDPLTGGWVQTLTYAVNLNEVDGSFRPVRFVSSFQVALLETGGNGNANWEVMPRPNQGASYGRGLNAPVEYLSTNNWNLRLSNGMQTQQQWLNRMYYAAEPLLNPTVEATVPVPTHFRVHFLHNTYEYEISQWKDVLRVNNDLPGNGALVYISWIKRTYNADLELAMTAVPLLLQS